MGERGRLGSCPVPEKVVSTPRAAATGTKKRRVEPLSPQSMAACRGRVPVGMPRME